MNVITAITTRRSVRRFNSTGVHRELLQEVLDVASAAPSSGDARPWSFVVIDRPELLAQVSAINPYATAADTAPAGIVVCGVLHREKFPGFWVQDCSACTYAILLAAHAKGLGANWTGIYPMRERVDEFRRLLQLPEGVIPFSLVLLGYSDRRPGEPIDREAHDNTHYNMWENQRSSIAAPQTSAAPLATQQRTTIKR